MNDPSHLLAPNRYCRRTFLQRLAVGALATCLLSRRAPASPRGSQFGWARLVTPSPYWNVHQEQDAQLARFVRDETGMAIDPVTYAVPPSSLEQLCTFPLIFTNDLLPVTDPAQLANIKEYLLRGGFFYIDGCVERKVTPNFSQFFHRHVQFYQRMFPSAQVRMLPENHPIFHAYFQLNEADTRNGRGARGHWDDVAEGIYGVYDGDRLISLFSLDHLQCGWPNDSERMAACMKLIANIYVYAMMR